MSEVLLPQDEIGTFVGLILGSQSRLGEPGCDQWVLTVSDILTFLADCEVTWKKLGI